jgi:hypothetical protein
MSIVTEERIGMNWPFLRIIVIVVGSVLAILLVAYVVKDL